MRLTITPELKKELGKLFVYEGEENPKLLAENPSLLAAKVMQRLVELADPTEPLSAAGRAAINPAMKAHCLAQGIELVVFANRWARTYPGTTFKALR